MKNLKENLNKENAQKAKDFTQKVLNFFNNLESKGFKVEKKEEILIIKKEATQAIEKGTKGEKVIITPEENIVFLIQGIDDENEIKVVAKKGVMIVESGEKGIAIKEGKEEKSSLFSYNNEQQAFEKIKKFLFN